MIYYIDSRKNDKKIKLTPPKRNRNKFNSKNIYILNKSKNHILNRSKRNSAKNLFFSNNSEDINIKNPIIISKNNLKDKEYLIIDKKKEKNKLIKNSISSIYDIKSNQSEFFQKNTINNSLYSLEAFNPF